MSSVCAKHLVIMYTFLHLPRQSLRKADAWKNCLTWIPVKESNSQSKIVSKSTGIVWHSSFPSHYDNKSLSCPLQTQIICAGSLQNCILEKFLIYLKMARFMRQSQDHCHHHCPLHFHCHCISFSFSFFCVCVICDDVNDVEI